jgi:hypothetical protein
MTDRKSAYLEAAIRVLHDAGRPMGTRELVDSIIASGLVKPRGRTPEATMRAQLYRSIQRGLDLKKLQEPGASRAKSGTVRWALKSWPDSERGE